MTEKAAGEQQRASGLGRVIEWFTRRDAMAAARSEPSALDEKQRALFERACGAFTTAERVSPSDGSRVPLEDVGDEATRAMIAIGILRDAVAWALAVDQRDAPTSLASAWTAADEDSLAKAAGNADALARVRRVLLDEDVLARAGRSVADHNADLAAVRTFAHALIDALERRSGAITRLHTQRWLRIVGALFAAVVVIAGIHFINIAAHPDLVPQSRWLASSADFGWGQQGVGLTGVRGSAGDLFFHTREENNPWVQFDLGRVAKFSRFVIENRTDCCQERALPMVIEASTDGQHWHELARRTEAFSTWEPSLSSSASARYVRLRVERVTLFHLRRVEIH
jgi:hypothetical protein